VTNGTTTQIVTNYDCAVCHAEGDVTKINAGTGWTSSTLHNDGSTSTTRMVHLRDVDDVGIGDTTYQFNKNTIDETMRDNMDTFCMTCHDSDGANTIAVKNTNDGLYIGTAETTTIRTGATPVAQRPFNTNDNLQNTHDGFARVRITDVFSQYDTSNPSHHAVRGARYSSRHSDSNSGQWDTATWTDYTLKDAAGSTMSTIKETATLHCADCHLSEQNAHGAVNAWHMLRNGEPSGSCWDPTATASNQCNGAGEVWDAICFETNYTDQTSCEGAGFTWVSPDEDTAMTGKIVGDDGPFFLNCYKCHNWDVYRIHEAADAGSRFTHDDDANTLEGVYGAATDGQQDGAQVSFLGPPCLLCHGGDGYGHIHGRGSSTDGDDGTYGERTPDPFPFADTDWTGGSYTKYRFMPGSWMIWSPRAGGPQADPDDSYWNTTQSGTMCYFGESAPNAWSNCSSHGNSSKASQSNYARPTSY
jgi:hypothetical protein